MSKKLTKALQAVMKEHDASPEDVAAALGLTIAAEEVAEEPKGKKGAKADKAEKPAKEGKGGKSKKEEPDALALVADLSDDELEAVAIDLGLTTAKKAKNMDGDALEALFKGADVEAVEDAIAKVVTKADKGGKSKDKGAKAEKPGKEAKAANADGKKGGKDGKKGKVVELEYDDMSTEQLVEAVVKRELATDKKAAKMSDDDLIDLLEADDEKAK